MNEIEPLSMSLYRYTLYLYLYVYACIYVTAACISFSKTTPDLWPFSHFLGALCMLKR